MYKKKFILLALALASDMAAILIAIEATLELRFWNKPYTEDLIPFIPGVLVVKLAIYALCGLYNFAKHKRVFDYFYESFWAETLASLAIFAIMLYIQVFVDSNLSTSRSLFLITWVVTFVLLAGWRTILKFVVKSKEDMTVRMLIVGGHELTAEVRQEISEYSYLGHEVVGLVGESLKLDKLPDAELDTNILGPLDNLENLINDYAIDEVIIISRDMGQSSIMEVIEICRRRGVILRILPNILEVMLGQVKIQDVAGIPLIELRTRPLSGWFRLSKRMLDFFVSLVLFVITLPILILAAVAIKLTSRGPIFYKQERLGYQRKPFHVIKFRTMVQDAEKASGPQLAISNDPRITSIGRFLRKTRIDELPQIINVLIGDMSLVGPRPERSIFVDRFLRENRFYERRFEVKPGITGLAQIHGRYDSDFQHKLRYDLAYINNISPILDAKILFNTIKVVITGKGAQ